MADLKNLGVPSVANRAFVPLAIEAGIEATIASLVQFATDLKTLLEALKDALAESNPTLADGLTLYTLGAILEYMAAKGDAPVMMTKDLPELADEDGPGSVVAARDETDNKQVNITFGAPPEWAADPTQKYTYEVYLDGVLAKHGKNAAVGGYVNDFITDVAAGPHTIRVLFVRPDGKQTRFGPVATVK